MAGEKNQFAKLRKLMIATEESENGRFQSEMSQCAPGRESGICENGICENLRIESVAFIYDTGGGSPGLLFPLLGPGEGDGGQVRGGGG